MKRREFIALSAIGGVAVLANSCANVREQEVEKNLPLLGAHPKAALNLASQEGRAPGARLEEKLDFLEANRFVGIEPWGSNMPDRVEEFQKALQNRAVKLSAVTSGISGYLIAQDEKIRSEARESVKRILEAAGALGSPGLIIVPAFNNQASLPHQEARAVLVDQLQELGEVAVQNNTFILLEPLNRREAYFLRQLADAAAIAKDAESEGVGIMGDFWHMTWEETSDLGAIISGGSFLRHMHIASRKRRLMPGEDEGDNYIDGFKGLKYIGYNGHISLECGTEGDPVQTILAAASLIREQWERA